MKTLFHNAILMATLFLTCTTSCVSAKSDKGDEGDTTPMKETRDVKDFHIMDIKSVGTIYFTQANTYSCKIEGETRYVKHTETTVADGKLSIRFDTQSRNIKNGITLHITAPSLSKVYFQGVGSFICKERLDADNIVFDVDGVGKLEVNDLHCNKATVNLDGVGKAKVNVFADKLTATVNGVGSMILSGKVKTADISRDGVGSIDKSDLKIENK
ncbi:DUF2807 domain-containing protein [uncultured Bacteroides sp.]|uniref:GIN domain-containing protein n=1 Tax=uncultured Bacteroides sp. TaxID=162156 RepID=UPI002629E39D|nr:DUF2807 domain-containing protein [uncultured Bacteroides sp.]